MKTISKHKSGYTLIEMLVTAAMIGILGMGIVTYSSTAIRMIARNLSTNHSHDAVRGSFERMLQDLHASASQFRLVNFDGTNYTDVTPTATTDQDAYSQYYASTRANGVKFMRFAGGPYKLVSDGSNNTTLATTATTLKFEFAVSGTLPYIPAVGDKVQIPLISREFDITAVTAPTSGNTKGTVTVSTGLGFTIYTSGTTPAGVVNPVTTGYFYERVGYTVYGNQLRYHSTYPPVAAGDTVVVRSNVTSPQPFALLFPTSTSTTSDNLNLRVSLEAYDLDYSTKLYQNGTTTLQTTIPSRTQPITLNGI